MQTPEGRFEAQDDLFKMPMSTMGLSYGDINNDGCYDFYFGTGNPESWFVLPNLMYLGEIEGTNCTGRVTNISMLHGFGTIQKGHGIVFFDFDEDGDQDIYSSLGGMWPADAWPNQLFVNNSELQNAWIKIRLRGRQTNRFGVGARIRITVSENGRTRSIFKYVNSGGSFGGNPLRQTIGLGKAEQIKQLEVYWPTSDRTQVFDGPAMDQCIRIREDADEFVKLPYRAFAMPAAEATGGEPPADRS